MANKGGIITKKDIIEEDALNWGQEYASLMQKAIDKNKEFTSGILQLIAAMKEIKKAGNNSDLLRAREEERLATIKNINAIREQETAEISANKIKRAAIATAEAERRATEAQTRSKDAATKSEERNTRAISANHKQTSIEIINQGVLARNAKTQAILNSKLTTEYEKLNAKKRLAATALQSIIIAGKKADESTAAYTLRLQKAQIEFDKLHDQVVKADRAISRFNDNVGNYPEFGAEQIRDLIGAFGVVVGVDMFATSVKEAFDVIRNFEAEMVNLAAIAGYTREEISPLEADIRAVAAVSINSATEVAQLATELIKLGSTPEEVSKLLKPVNNLSIALQASAEESASLVKGLLNAYQEGAEEATRFTDVLAESANRSALDFQGLKDAFSYLAPTAKTLNIPIERTAAILGVLADNNIRAESAGRLTSTAFIRLAKNGIAYEDALKQINDAQKENKTNLEVLALAGELFGAEAAKIGIILANNVGKIDESTIAYQNSGGALEELTNKQLKSINSELDILSSAWEEYILDTNEANGGTKAITSTLQFLSGNLNTIADAVLFAGAAWLAYKASLILANIQKKIMVLLLKQQTVAQAENTATTTAGTTAQVANAGATTVATTAWQRFNTALKANVLGIIVVALLLLISTMDSYGKSLEDKTEEIQSNTDAFLKNKETVSKNDVALKSLSKRYEELIKKTNRTTEEQKELEKITKTLAKAVPEATTSVNEYGEALTVNTKKIKEFTANQRELYAVTNRIELKKNIDLLKEQSKEQNRLNLLQKDGKEAGVGEGRDFIIVKNMNGVLKTRNNVFQEWKVLTDEQLQTYLKEKKANEDAVTQTKARIDALRGLTKAQIEEAKAEEETSIIKNEAGARTIAIIDEEIKALEDSIATLSDKTGKEGNAIKRKIAALTAERELIFSTVKAEKTKVDNGLKGYKKITDAIYQLTQFRYQNEIDQNQKIIDDEKRTTNEKLEALYNISQIRESKNAETLQQELLNNALSKEDLDKLTVAKFKKYKEDANNRIRLMIEGKISSDKLTNQEKLILEKFYADKKNMQDKDAKDKQALIDAEIAVVQKKTEREIQEQTRILNSAIEAENDRFVATNDRENRNLKKREKAIKDHEGRIFQIKKAAAMDALQIQIDSLQSLLDFDYKAEEKNKKSVEVRKKLEADLQAYRTELSDLRLQNHQETTDKMILTEEQYNERVKELSDNLVSALAELTNALFEARITNIDNELSHEQEKYDRSIKAAGDDQRKKDLLTAEFEKKQKALEAKKREEQKKQAIFNKAIAVAEIGMKTAQAIVAALAVGPPQGFVFAALAGVIGAIQLAAVLATPIPKYKSGRKGGPAEFAEVGDGYVTEVISDPDGSNPRLTPAKPTLTFLDRGEMVHKSVDDYKKFMGRSDRSNIGLENKKLSDYYTSININNDNSELVNEMRLTRKAMERMKTNVIVNTQKPQDINYELWKFKNTNWNQ